MSKNILLLIEEKIIEELNKINNKIVKLKELLEKEIKCISEIKKDINVLKKEEKEKEEENAINVKQKNKFISEIKNIEKNITKTENAEQNIQYKYQINDLNKKIKNKESEKEANDTKLKKIELKIKKNQENITSRESELKKLNLELKKEMDSEKSVNKTKTLLKNKDFWKVLIEIENADKNSKQHILLSDLIKMSDGFVEKNIKFSKKDKEHYLILKTKNLFSSDLLLKASEKTANEILKKFSKTCLGMSGSELKSVCTEAGYAAIRKNKTNVILDDFLEAHESVLREEEFNNKEHLQMFG